MSERSPAVAATELAQLLSAARARTPARVFRGRLDGGYTTASALALRADHAAARDAVHAALDSRAPSSHRSSPSTTSSRRSPRPRTTASTCCAPISAGASPTPRGSSFAGRARTARTCRS
jgi:hypothetical protein